MGIGGIGRDEQHAFVAELSDQPSPLRKNEERLIEVQLAKVFGVNRDYRRKSEKSRLKTMLRIMQVTIGK